LKERSESENIKGLAKTYYNLVRFRVTLSNTLRYPHSYHPYLRELLEETQERVRRLVTLCKSNLENYDIYNVFLKKVKGIGPVMAAYLLDYFDIEKAKHVSSFWKFAGLAPGCYRTRGKKVEYNPVLKSIILGRVFRQLQMARGYYHNLYRMFRSQLEKQHPEWGKSVETIGLYHTRARLKTMKVFLQHLWLIWRKLENLPISKPYSVEKLDHSYIEPPLDQDEI